MKSAVRMGYTGRLIPVRVMVEGVEREVMRPLKWLKAYHREQSRKRRRSGPKVVRSDTDTPEKTGP